MDSRGEAPIACTLGTGDYRERLAWIAELARDGLLSVKRGEDLEVELRYAPSVADRIREMVGKEQECCAFLSFAVSESSEDVRLTITAPELARYVAAALFEQFVQPAFWPHAVEEIVGLLGYHERNLHECRRIPWDCGVPLGAVSADDLRQPTSARATSALGRGAVDGDGS